MEPPRKAFCVVVALLLCAGLSAPLRGQSLLVHLECDGSTSDSSPNGRDGTLVEGSLGGSSYIAGPVGTALKLDHDPATITTDKTQGTYVSIPLRLPAEGSILFWFRVGDLYNYQALWDTSGNADDWEMWIYQEGNVRGRIDANVGQVNHFLDQPNSWYHIAYTWKRGDQAHLWINGVEVDTASTVRAITEAKFDAAILGDTFFLGGGNAGNTCGVGVFDEVRVYDAPLSAATIRSVMLEGMPPEIHWIMDGDLTNSGTLGAAGDGVASSGPNGTAAFVPTLHGEGLLLDNVAPASHMTEGASVSVPHVLPETGSIALWYYVRP